MQFTKFLLILSLLLLLLSAGVARAAECGTTVTNTITVDKLSGGKFTTVQAAIDSVPENNDKWIKIHIKPGIYKEKVQIPDQKPCIILEGEDRATTKITNNGHEQTDLSATFTSSPENIIVKGITFENSYNLGSSAASIEQALSAANRNQVLSAANIKQVLASSNIKQALAARVYGDKSAFYDCGFVGVQDTLWDVQGRHYFDHCYIEGAIDFIFGSGQSIYEDCTINSTVGLRLGKNVGASYVTAQKRDSKSDPNGFVFVKGQVVGSGQTYLGRAYGPYSRVIFYQTMLSSNVYPPGWNNWGINDYGDLFFAEVECTGPGSNTAKRVPWVEKIDGSHMRKFDKSVFIDQDGWLNECSKLI